MQRDYYQILGVDPSADLQQIKAAYRRKSLEHHPDRGGSHEQMVLINEAWEILSDPVRRQHHDEACAEEQNDQAQQAAAADARAAHERAQNYPRDWSTFERKMNAIFDDFTRARYDNEGCISTVGNSTSGAVFIVGGVVTVGFLAAQLWPHHTTGILWSGLILGSLLGQSLHHTVGQWIRQYQNSYRPSQSQSSPSPPPPPPPASPSKPPPLPAAAVPPPIRHQIIRCEQCNKRLRIPSHYAAVTVNCPACKQRFTFRRDPA